MQGSGSGNAIIGEYNFCKNMGISKVDMDEMDEEDVLAFSWIMRREAKNNKR